MDEQSFKERIERLSRLRRLGVYRGAHHLNSSPKTPPEAPPTADSIFITPDEGSPMLLEEAVAGLSEENAYGSYFYVENRAPLNLEHGRQPLQALLSYSPDMLKPGLAESGEPMLSWQEVLFLDTETSGLDIAAGTIAFMIGLGWFEGQEFVVRQLFMRDYPEEPAILASLAELAGRFRAIATFNGRSFDLPLLENRLVQARLPLDLLDLPHFDLLPPSRRLWRLRLASCSLGNLEKELLAVQRTEQDIPGWAIPDLYRAFLNTGDARPLTGVFYHNRIDVLSMAALGVEICRHLASFTPTAGLPAGDIHPLDALSLGEWLFASREYAAAEKAMSYALQKRPEPAVQTVIMRRLGILLKRLHRYEQALPLWLELAGGGFAPDACEELAKYYEWRENDMAQAKRWAEEGEKQAWRLSAPRQTKTAWEHRLRRLNTKLK